MTAEQAARRHARRVELGYPKETPAQKAARARRKLAAKAAFVEPVPVVDPDDWSSPPADCRVGA